MDPGRQYKRAHLAFDPSAAKQQIEARPPVGANDDATHRFCAEFLDDELSQLARNGRIKRSRKVRMESSYAGMARGQLSAAA